MKDIERQCIGGLICYESNWFDMIWCSVVTSLLFFVVLQEPIRYAPGDPIEAFWKGWRVVDSAWKRRNAKGCQRIQRSLYIVLRCAKESKDFSRLKFSLFFSILQSTTCPTDSVATGANRANCFDVFRLGYASSFVSMQRRLRCTDVMVRRSLRSLTRHAALRSRCQSCSWTAYRCRLSDLAWSGLFLGRIDDIDGLLTMNWCVLTTAQIWVCKDSVIEEGLISVPNCWFLTSLSQVQPLHGEQRRTFLLSCLRLGCWANDNNVHIVAESKGKFFMMPLFTRLDETTSAKCLS